MQDAAAKATATTDMVKKPIRLIHGFFTVGGWTLVSRILGFVRDIAFAAVLGAGPVAEAFLVAFSLPNMFRRLFAEGAFNMAFVPMYSKKLESGSDPDEFANGAFSVLGGFLVLFTVVLQAAMPLLVLAMASGFLSDDRFDLAVLFGRIAFPYVLFISLAALVSGMLGASGRFAAAAAAPALLNIMFISAIALAYVSGLNAGLALAWTTPVAGAAQLALVWLAASRAGLRIRIRRPRMTPDLKRLAIIAAPAALAGGVVQVNLLIGRQVASFFDGAVAWLSYADRLYQLPLGVVGIAIGVVLLPDLSRRLSTGDDAGGQNAFNRAAEAALALALPATAAFVAVAFPIVSVLFQRGEFTAVDSGATALALTIYAAGLPAFVLQKVVQPLYFAREDTRTPFRYAVVSMIVNAVLAVGLAGYIGYAAAAVGTTVAGWAMLLLLWHGARRMGAAAKLDVRLLKTAPKIALASVIMGILLWAASGRFEHYFSEAGTRYVALAVLVISGAAVYGGLLAVLRVWSRDDIGRFLRRSQNGSSNS